MSIQQHHRPHVPASALLRCACVALLLTLVLAPARVPAQADPGVPVLRDFEDLPVGTFVSTQYVGVSFPGSTNSNQDGSLPLTIVQPTQATASPNRALQSHFDLGCEFCGTHLTMQFDEPQYRVSLSTGLAGQGPAGGPGATMLLQGYDGDPNLPGSHLIVQTVAPCMGQGPTPVTTPLEVDDGAARIRYAYLSIVSCDQPTNDRSGGDNGTLLIDNLLYDRPLHPPAHETIPPVVHISYPLNGSTVTGDTTGATLIDIRATVYETAIYSMTAQVNGHAPVPMSFYQTSPGVFDARTIVNGTQGLVEGVNTVVVRAWDFDQPQNTGSDSSTFTFHVKPPPPPTNLDIIPTALEVTQSIDEGPHRLGDEYLSEYGFDVPVAALYDPPLVQDKPTLIRIYAAASGTTTPVQGVPAVMDVERNHCTSNCAIATRLAPMAGWSMPGIPIPNPTGITVFPFGTPGSDPNRAAASLGATWDFLLQPDWTHQDQDLIVTVHINAGNFSGLAPRSPVRECATGIAGQCYYNNEVKLYLHFQPAPEITINPVFIHVTGSYKGQTYQDAVPTQAQFDAILQRMNELYPAHVLMGQRYDMTVSPGTSGDDLVGRIGDYYGFRPCFARPSTDVFYLGLFPGNQSNPPFSFGANDPQSDGTYTAGRATVPGWQGSCQIPGAWTDADSSFGSSIDAAHELGHNIGFDHWACENGNSADECGVFPIPHGGIGGVGTDIAGWRVIPPGDNSSNSTPHSHDFMSYGQLCGVQVKGVYIYGGSANCDLGEWVSWYTYQILLDHSALESYDTSDPPALAVSGSIAADGTATLRPVYRIDTSFPITDHIAEDDASSIYTIQGYDSNGNTILVHNFEPSKIDIHGPEYGKVFVFNEVVPVVPNLQRLAVLHGGRVLGDLRNPAPGQGPTVRVDLPTSGSIWTIGAAQTIRWTASSPAGVPLTALVEYSPDGGKTRVTLGRDISGAALTISPDQLAGSTQALVYVQVSDGLNTATAQAGPFTVQPQPPSVHIMWPQTGGQVVAHVPLTLQGTAFDRQEPLIDRQFRWTSDRDGFLGTGQQLSTAHLSVGLHRLTLTVTDSRGLIGRDSVRLQVVLAPPDIVLSPATASPGARVTVTGWGFGAREEVTLALNGAALPTMPPIIVTTKAGAFTAAVTAPDSLLSGANALSATGNQSRGNALATLMGRVPGANPLYFAGASTMAGEQARLAILNPSAQPAHLSLIVYGQTDAPRHALLTVAAHSRGSVNLNTLVGPNPALGIKVSADRPVAAQLRVTRLREDGFGLSGVAAPSTQWYLAEGYTNLSFHEVLALLNPGQTPARVQLRLLPASGQAARTVTVIVAPQRTRLVDVNGLLPNHALSVIATSTAPIVLARRLTFSTTGYGITAKTGTNRAATSWIFAGGATRGRFQTFLTMLNPNAARARVTARFYGRAGQVLGSRSLDVPGLSRVTIRLNDVVHASDVASVVTSDAPLVVEQPEYFGSPNGHDVAGSDVFGSNGTGLNWAVPGGTTDGVNEDLLIYNPSTLTAVIDVSFYGADGRVTTRRLSVEPTAGYAIRVNGFVPRLTTQHSITLRSANGVGVAIEQTVYAPTFSSLSSSEGIAT